MPASSSTAAPLFERVSIIGIGLIGASLALSMRQQNLATQIVCGDVKPEHVKKALELKLVDEATTELADALSSAALPVLFGTVSVMIEVIVYLVASFYFIVYGDKFIQAIRRILHTRYHGEFDRLISEINTTLGANIRGKALLVAIMTNCSFILI